MKSLIGCICIPVNDFFRELRHEVDIWLQQKLTILLILHVKRKKPKSAVGFNADIFGT